MKTRTGSFPIGFRRGGRGWFTDLPALIEWALAHELEVIDLGSDADTSGKQVQEAGLRIGSVDLPGVKGMISPDRAKRQEAIAQAGEYVRACAPLGSLNYFLTMLPEDPARPRAENFGYMVESFGELAPVLEENGARLVVEGWPGPGALCCTPEGCRAFFAEIPSPAAGLNYDPSHLVRMGIDHLRFLDEFADRVHHVHGKDTELLAENLYEFGTEQPPTFAKPLPYAGMHWRYAIPGHGVVRWTNVMRTLVARGYAGCISIELEDANFHENDGVQKMGILQGAAFLAGC